MRELGADHVVDYTREEPSGSYDVVLQIAGNRSLSQLRRLLTPRGTLVLVGRGVGRDGTGGMLALLTGMVGARVRSRKDGKRIVSFIAKIKSDDLATVAQLAVPAVSKVYALDDAASAVADIEAGHTRGKIAISVQSA
ncbi:MAG TPA: zinc-binding dehydrogenase [Gaiellaceae bacterium]|nr:zinc-binding dehydrogenase [Gaiellaceae bacterium]